MTGAAYRSLQALTQEYIGCRGQATQSVQRGVRGVGAGGNCRGSIPP
jgi:hypothetical protein